MSIRKDQELTVITKTYDLILWSCNHTSKFPRNHRFVPGERIEGNHQPANVRSANRNRNAPSNRNTNNGFRPASTWQQDAHPVPPEFESFSCLGECSQVQVAVTCRVASVVRANEAQARRVW